MDKLDAILMALAFLALGWMFGHINSRMIMENEAAKTSCAQYNPVTSDFEWLGGKSQ
jgi:hypothetical protein